MGCGMVRKVDELGRVVVPKEMRRVLGIKPGSSVEMSIDTQNNVVLKKFSEIENLGFFAQTVADVLFEVTDNPVCICDDERVVACKGVSKKLIDDKESISICVGGKSDNIEYATYKKCFFRQIKSDGSVCGYIIMMSMRHQNLVSIHGQFQFLRQIGKEIIVSSNHMYRTICSFRQCVLAALHIAAMNHHVRFMHLQNLKVVLILSVGITYYNDFLHIASIPFSSVLRLFLCGSPGSFPLPSAQP